MSTISAQGIQRDPLAFLRRLEAGESLLVVQDDRALARVHPILQPTATLRPFGLLAGRFTAPADFDEPLPDEILEAFEGR